MVLSQLQVEGTDQTVIEQSNTSARSLLQNHLKATVLLGGSVRTNAMAEAIGRLVIDLPVDGNGTIFGLWIEHVEQLVQRLGHQHHEIRLLIDQKAHDPWKPVKSHHATIRIERDPLELRGTGGLLRDLAEAYDDDDLILVAPAGYVLLNPLTDLVDALASLEADVSLISHEEGTPSGLMIVRCGCLRSIPEIGFVDMKEQALPEIARHRRVSVIHRTQATGLPITTLVGYIRALRAHHLNQLGVNTLGDAFAEEWRTAFAIMENSSSVHPSAQVHDSVILAGGRVESGAVVARSIVCPNGVVRRNETVVDSIVSTSIGQRKRRRK